jgi:hypothetical protein
VAFNERCHTRIDDGPIPIADEYVERGLDVTSGLFGIQVSGGT